MRDLIERWIGLRQAPQQAKDGQSFQAPADGHLRDLDASSTEQLPYRVQRLRRGVKRIVAHRQERTEYLEVVPVKLTAELFE